jgi:hypothetical protein
MVETVSEHFRVAELHDGVVTPGHFYFFRNDPTGHDNHVHVAFQPWGEPDEPDADVPDDPGAGSPAARTMFAVLVPPAAPPRFPGTHNGGVYAHKHRNSDPAQPWSQHALIKGNAIDIMCDHETADEIARWLTGPWEDDVDAVQNVMLRREWFMLAAAADEFGIQHPETPEEDAETGDEEPFKGWATKVGRRLARNVEAAAAPPRPGHEPHPGGLDVELGPTGPEGLGG